MATDDIFFTWKDLKRQWDKKRTVYIRYALIGFSLVGAYQLVKTPLYEADALFTQADQRSDHAEWIRSFLKNVGGMTRESNAEIVMQSRSLLKQTIAHLGLQATVCSRHPIYTLFSHIKDNLLGELSVQRDEPERFVFSHVQYEGNKPFSCYLKVIDANQYEILDVNKQKVASACLGQTVSTPYFSMVLEKIPSFTHLGKSYPLRLDPWPSLVKKALKGLTIKTSKNDRQALKLTFAHSHPRIASDFLNTLMSCYQNHLKRENEEVAQTQLEYLERRQKELVAHYDKALQEHVSYLSKSLGENGFINLKQELEILEKPKEEYLSKLFEVELELSRLKPSYLQREKERKKKKEQEKIEKALSSTKEDRAEMKKKLRFKEIKDTSDLFSYEKQYATAEKKQMDVSLQLQKMETILKSSSKQLEEIFNQKRVLKQILDYAEGCTITLPSVSADGIDVTVFRCLSDLKNDPNPVVLKEKRNRLKETTANALQKLQEKQKCVQQEQEQIFLYPVDLSGIDPETAQTLYVDYNQKLNDIHLQIQELVYMQDQILDPDCELSSFSTFLTDPISQDMIRQASLAALELKDTANHSYKDLQRLQEMLSSKKKFLKEHISQTIDRLKMQEALIQDKITSLQSSFVHLLETEKGLIEDRLHAMQDRMRLLPEKWKKENELILKRDLSIGMIEGLTQLAESKNIDRRLFTVESKPIDFAHIPVKTKPGYLLVFSILAAFCTASAIYLKDVFSWIVKGSPLSLDTLPYFGFHTVGMLSPYVESHFEEMRDTDKETLRNLSHFILHDRHSSLGLCVAVMGTFASQMVDHLACLVSKRGKKVLVIQCDAELLTSGPQKDGLLQYLEGEIDHIPIYKERSYDKIVAGRYMPYAIELLSLSKFSHQLESYKQSYDCILVCTRTSIRSASLYSHFTKADVCVVCPSAKETMNDLKEYRAGNSEKMSQYMTVILQDFRELYG